MFCPNFSYLRPNSLAEAGEMLAHYKGQAKVLAGGTDLLVNLKLGKLSPPAVVSLSGLEELYGDQRDNGTIRIGALTTAARLADGGGIPRVLSAAAGALGSPQVRNRATIGGNLATARPAGDLCVALLALGASAVAVGGGGQRFLALEQFFQGPGATALAADEIITAATLPAPKTGSGGGFCKLGLRQAMEIALVSVAAHLELEADGKTIAWARVALGAVAPTPLLSAGAAAALQGARAGEKCFASAAQAAAADAKPIDDHRGSADYRRDMVRTLTVRALSQALARARGGKEVGA